MNTIYCREKDRKKEDTGKNSPKGFLASKCDVENWVFSKIGIFENSLEILCIFLGFLGGLFWDFFGGFFFEDFFREDFLEDFF